MRQSFFRRWAALFVAVLIGNSVVAQVPQLINYQGRVAVDAVNFDGQGQFKFALVNAAGTTAYWTNDGTHLDGSQPDLAVTLTVTKGLYSVLLGDANLTNMQIVPATVFTHGDVHLRVWFNDGPHGFQLLTPDQRIAAVGYAIMAGTAQTVADGAITSAKIAPGAVGSSQLAPNITVGGTLTAANFAGDGQGLTALSAANIATGTLGDTLLSANVPLLNAATNIFTGTLKTTGTLDVSNAAVLGFDKISLAGANTWTGPQTFTDVTIAAVAPSIVFQNATIASSFGLGLSTDFGDAKHDFFIMGMNMKATPTGYSILSDRKSAWGLALERDYFNGETVQHEAYFFDGGSFRPFLFGYSQAANADVVSIVDGTVTIANSQVDDFLIPGLRFQFPALTGNSGVEANTFYKVKTVLSPTTFTFMDSWGGPAINATATGGVMKRGGWGNAGYAVPLVVNCFNYDGRDTPASTAFQVTNSKVGSETLVRFDNEVGSRVALHFNQKWRLGTDLAGTDAGGFYLMNLNGGLNDSVIQVDASSRVAIGYKRSEDGYVPHTNTGTLDVNGVIVATRAALPVNVIEGGFIVVNGTPYIGSGGIWRALSFAP